MSNTIDFKSAYEPNEFVKQIYDIQNNRLISWRNRYSKEEYSYKVALNTLYQLLTCELMWNSIISSFGGKKVYSEFSDAYSIIQAKSGETAKASVHATLESKYRTIQKVSIVDMNSIRNMVLKAQNGNNEMVKEVEHAYICYTGAVELIYGWAALGLTGKDIQGAIMEMCGIIIGGNYTDMDVAITNFGQIVDSCYVPLENLW